MAVAKKIDGRYYVPRTGYIGSKDYEKFTSPEFRMQHKKRVEQIRKNCKAKVTIIQK